MSRNAAPRSGLIGLQASALLMLSISGLLLLGACGGPPAEGEDPAGQVELGGPLEGVFVTEPGFAACQDVDRFHEMMAHVANGESEAYRALIEDPDSGCLLMNGDVEVSVLSWNGTFAEIQPLGTTTSVWTVSEAVQPAGDGDAGVRQPG